MKIQINFVSSFGVRNSTNSPRFARGVVVQANPFKNRGLIHWWCPALCFNGGQDKCLGKAFARLFSDRLQLQWALAGA